jgi:hypothetical protein
MILSDTNSSPAVTLSTDDTIVDTVTAGGLLVYDGIIR